MFYKIKKGEILVKSFKPTRVFLMCVAMWLLYSKSIYASDIEVKVTDFDLAKGKGTNTLKIVQVSDIHISSNPNSIELLKDTVSIVNKQKADIVLFTGDLYDANRKYEKDINVIIEQLSKIEASVGKYAVYGNHDAILNQQDRFEKTIIGGGFTLLKNQGINMHLGMDKYISLVGLHDAYSKELKTKEVLEKLKENYINILLFHEPDMVDEFTKYPIDIQFSGHSHGGQVRTLEGKPLTTTPLGTKYVDGIFNINNRTTLIVNRGIGTSRQDIRVNCPPTIEVVNITI